MAADAASFRTEIVSISLGSTKLRFELIPSTSMSGFESPIVPIPRILMVPASCPGSPDLCVTVTPAAIPCKAIDVWVTGFFASSSPSIDATEPVRLIFFCTPYPIATTSSIPMASSAKITLIFVFPATTISCAFIPTNENCKVAFAGIFDSE